MNWIVSKAVCTSNTELQNRLRFIEEVTGLIPSHWNEENCIPYGTDHSSFPYYICRTKKGEYGIVITAHIDEVESILNTVLSCKRAIVIVNSCMISKVRGERIKQLVLSKNRHS